MAKSLKTLGLEITELCNFNCVHCYLDKRLKPKVNLEFASTIAKIAYDAGFAAVYITGGEPTLHPQFHEIYDVFRRQGYLVNVYTNGSILTERTLNLFKEVSPVSVEITIYGMNEESYYETTKVRSFSMVIKNIRTLVDNGIKVVLKYQLLLSTKQYFSQFLEFTHEMGCDVAVNAQIIPKLNGDMSPLLYRLKPAEIIEIGNENGFDFTPSGDGFEGCDAGENMFIDSQGIMRGCPVLRTGFDQSALTNPLKTITDSERLFRDFHKKRHIPLCPAWLALEGPEMVNIFLKGLKRE